MVDRSSILANLADRTSRQRAADAADKLAAERRAERDKYLKALDAACRGPSSTPKAAIRALFALRDVLDQQGRLSLVRQKAAEVAALGGRWSELPGHEGAFSSSLLADGLDLQAKAADLTSDLDRFCKQLVESYPTWDRCGLGHFYETIWTVVERVCRAISASDEDWTRWDKEQSPKAASLPARGKPGRPSTTKAIAEQYLRDEFELKRQIAAGGDEPREYVIREWLHDHPQYKEAPGEAAIRAAVLRIRKK